MNHADQHVISGLRTLSKPFLAMCLLRVAPQDLPASYLLLGITTAAYLVLGSLLAAVYYPFPSSLLVGATETALVWSLVAILLAVHGHLARLAQTLISITGTGAVLNGLALPLSLALVSSNGHGFNADTLQLLSFALLFWSWTITAHILRHALSTRFGAGMAMSIVFFVITLTLMRALFPEPGGELPLETSSGGLAR